jgi:phospholipid transport system substrate-binding protein
MSSRIRVTSPTNSQMARRRLLAAIATVLMLGSAWRTARAEPSAEQARELIQGVGDEVLEILRDSSLSDDQKVERLVDLLEGPIDLDLVARLILGRHWRTASEAQRQEYLELFRGYALNFLASKLHLYRGQSYEVLDAQVISERDALVTTRILDNQGPPLKVDWRLREQDGTLMAIDVIVEGVSLIVTQRSEFGSVIERQGFEGLLAELRSRIGQERQAT